MSPGGTPPATRAIVLVTVAVSLLLWFSGFDVYERAVVQAGVMPGRLTGGLTIPSPVPAWLTPLTSTLLHQGVAHLAFNMMLMLWVGRLTEWAIGPGRLLLIYVVGAYAAALAQTMVTPDSPVPMVGASGAVSAVLAVYALLFGRSRAAAGKLLSSEARTVVWIALAWIALQFLTGLVLNTSQGGVAIFAHIGGFLAGLVIGYPMMPRRPMPGDDVDPGDDGIDAARS